MNSLITGFAEVNSDTIKILKILILRFHHFILQYCKQYNLKPECLHSFLYHNHKHQWGSDTYKYLIDAPKYYLVASKSFKHYYYELDIDFKYDILTFNEYQQYLQFIRRHKEIYILLQKLLQIDFVDC